MSNREKFEAWGMSDTDLRITLECETYAGIAWLAWQAATNEVEAKLAALTNQLEGVAAENAARKSEVPLGAIENGRAFADRLEAYSFECQGGNLSMCSDWQDLISCFEHLAEWAMHGQDETPATDAFLAEVRASGVDVARNALIAFVEDEVGPNGNVPGLIRGAELCESIAAQFRKGAAK